MRRQPLSDDAARADALAFAYTALARFGRAHLARAVANYLACRAVFYAFAPIDVDAITQNVQRARLSRTRARHRGRMFYERARALEQSAYPASSPTTTLR